MITKIAHIADIHLRSSQYGYTSRGEDFLQGFLNAIDAAIKSGVDAILCAGDIVNSTHPSADVIKSQLTAAADKLVAANIPMYVTAGNHDNTTPHWCAGFPAGIIHLDSEKVQVGCVTVTGIPFMAPDALRAWLADSQHSGDVLMWHGPIKEFCGYPSANVIEIADFPLNKWKLIAMGDQHIHRYEKRAEDDLIVAYPGSTELCSSSEDPQKNIYVYTFTDGIITDVESVPFKTREVQKFIIMDNLELEDAVTKVKSGALIFVEYNANELQNVLPRLKAMCSDDTIFRLKPIARKAAVKGTRINLDTIPVQEFMTQRSQELIKDTELATLCAGLLDPAMDHRLLLDDYCESVTEGRIAL